MNKVLIVDDDRLNQRVLTKIIGQNKTFEVIGAVTSGEEAVDLSSSSLPDIIFMDIMLPGMNGFETAKQIRKMNPKVDICIISAYQNLNFIKEALKLNIKEYLTKPFSVDAVEKVLAGYHAAEPDYLDILEAVQEIIEVRDYRMVYSRIGEIVEKIFRVTGRKRDKIVNVTYAIEKFLLNQYFVNPFDQTQMREQFPVNESMIDDEMVLEMWLSKVIDFVYRYRFIKRYVLVKPVFDYIDEHLKEYISMLSIIENCHISQQYMLRLFKEQMKISTLEYIQTRKMMLAKWYFCLGDYSTLDVAVMLGFEDAGYFSKIFKKYEQVTPYQYKSMLDGKRKAEKRV